MVRDDGGFEELMARLRAGDDAAETLVFRRYMRRLIALAGRQFAAWMRDRADVEDVVLSAYRSFFLRNGRGEYQVDDWGQLWSLLAVITLRKCSKRRRHLRAARRDAGRDVGLPEPDAEEAAWIPDRAPTPAEAAILTETVEQLLRVMTPDDRAIVEQILIGYTAAEVAERLDCSERTVRRVRQRAKSRLQRLLEAGAVGAGGG